MTSDYLRQAKLLYEATKTDNSSDIDEAVISINSKFPVYYGHELPVAKVTNSPFDKRFEKNYEYVVYSLEKLNERAIKTTFIDNKLINDILGKLILRHQQALDTIDKMSSKLVEIEKQQSDVK